MAKASINFAKSHIGGLKHNDRTQKKEIDYLLPVEHRLKNEVDFSALESEQKIKDLYTRAQEKYQDNFGQKLQAKSYLWEAAINLNKEHDLQDVQRLVKEIEKETGFTSVQIAIHRDEGRIERGTPIRNLHAHVTFFTLDKNTGQQLYRKSITAKQKNSQPKLKPMNRNRLSKLQDITAEVLKMERGKRGSKSVRMGHKQYKQHAQQMDKQKEELLDYFKAVSQSKEQDQDQAKAPTVKLLKAEIATLRAELKERGAKRPEYAALEQLNRELKDQIKKKTLTIDGMQEQINALKGSNLALESKIEGLEGQSPTVTPAQLESLKTIARLDINLEQIQMRAEKERLIKEVAEISARYKELNDSYDDLSKRVAVLMDENTELRAENTKLNGIVSIVVDWFDKARGIFLPSDDLDRIKNAMMTQVDIGPGGKLERDQIRSIQSRGMDL